MPATKTANKKPSTKQKAANAAKRTTTNAAKRKPVEVQPEPQTRGDAISAAMKELADVRTTMRAKRDGTPAKHLVFDIWYKDIAGFNVDAVAKKFPEVKATTIRSWVSGWRRSKGVGSAYPSNARGKEKQIQSALKKAGVAA